MIPYTQIPAPPSPAGFGAMTVRSLFAADGIDIGDRLVAGAALDPSARHVAPADRTMWEGAYRQLSELVQSFLAVDVSTVLLGGFSTTSALVEAALQTRGSDERAVVQLSGHKYTLRQQPSIDVMLGDLRVSTLDFDLTVAADVTALSAIVQRGRLTGFTSGVVEFSASLICDGASLASASRTLDPHLVASLGSGLPLLPEVTLSSQTTGRLLPDQT